MSPGCGQRAESPRGPAWVKVSGTSEGTGVQEPQVCSRVSVPRARPGTCPSPGAPPHAGLVTRHMEVTGL